ncbi:acetoacetate metabolism regulatory protein AtoC [Candidatus Magnetomorum sp. HK-1]|nr:acetoacetate metabolism regulatory protein AtoC [Candidatus Magnetomorum sp. HK-1]
MNPSKILVVDNDVNISKTLTQMIEREGFKSYVAGDGTSALKMLHTECPDVLLLDLDLSGIKAMNLLAQIKSIDSDLPVIIISAFANLKGAVKAMRAGAYDYIGKPFEYHDVVRVIRRATEDRRLKQKLKQLSSQVEDKFSLTKKMGTSEAVCKLILNVSRVAKSDFTVVIIGESGSGKELISRAIHHYSHRKDGPFVAIDCGAIPETLLESELFGYEKGAFTGATKHKQGKFEMAKNGTLLLDEISNMTLGSQAKLLRAIQEKTIYRVGSTDPFEIDVRILVSSNQDIGEQKVSNTFRKDLYYRLNEFTIRIPPLRKRKEDIPYLANLFIEKTNLELGKSVRGFSEQASEILLKYHWPGNVRQLKTSIRRAVLLSDEIIEIQHLDIADKVQTVSQFTTQEQSWIGRSLKEIVQEQTLSLEKEVIQFILDYTKGNKSKAAKLLKIDYKTMYNKIKLLGIKR